MTSPSALPRGIRNNNPGNIRHSAATWEGKATHQSDPDFVMFTAPEYGIRALARNLLTYQDKYELTTIQQIIHRWAPAVENPTAAYVQHMAVATGLLPTTPIRLRDDPDLFRSVVAAMIAHENGPSIRFGRAEWFDRNTIDRGIAMAMHGSFGPSS